ncbi:hypothetical protein L218DRAFT_946450 [Marasmius fiardii PR-910]|nr:hypothetical protein L218DRAFT_946450 [Marasmius fiardii PR-910]
MSINLVVATIAQLKAQAITSSRLFRFSLIRKSARFSPDKISRHHAKGKAEKRRSPSLITFIRICLWFSTLSNSDYSAPGPQTSYITVVSGFLQYVPLIPFKLEDHIRAELRVGAVDRVYINFVNITLLLYAKKPPITVSSHLDNRAHGYSLSEVPNKGGSDESE